MILSDSECGVAVGARRVFLETADVLGYPPTQPPLAFTRNTAKKRKCQISRKKHLLMQ